METQVPENLADLDRDALTALLEQLEAEFDAIYADGGDIAVLGTVADAIDGVRQHIQHHDDMAAAEAEQREALRARVQGAEQTDEADVIDAAAEDDDAEGVAEADTAEAPAEADEQERELVTAAATPPRAPSARAVSNKAPAPTAPPREDDALVITAAADVPGYATGSRLDKSNLSLAMHAKARGLSNGSQRVPVATVKTATPQEWFIDNASDAEAIIAAAVKHDDAAALVASGGWCTPSDVMYDLFGVESRNGIFDLPTVGVSRGGIQVPSHIALDAVDSGLWTWSEALDATGALAISDITVTSNVATVTTAAAHNLSVGSTVTVENSADPIYNGTHVVTGTPSGTTYTFAKTTANDAGPNAGGTSTAVKGCIRIPCPTWTDYRLEAEGVCVSHGNLMDRSYPEMTTRFLGLVMTAHLHRLGVAALAKVIASASAVTVTSAPSDAAGDLLNAIDLQVADYRSQYTMSEDAVLEAVFPQWIRAAVRSSLAMRAGVSELSVSDAQVTGFFTARNVRPQFVHGYEQLYTGASATAWPSTSKFLLYPAGGYVMGDGGAIDLGAVRDSTLNATNDYTAAWSEQFYLVMQRGPAAREVTFTSDVTGQTGGPQFAGA